LAPLKLTRPSSRVCLGARPPSSDRSVVCKQGRRRAGVHQPARCMALNLQLHKRCKEPEAVQRTYDTWLVGGKKW
jgi:hypothetical protein